MTYGDWGGGKASGQNQFYIAPTATSLSGHISCEPLVFVSKQFVLGVEQTNIMFGFSLFVVLIVLSIRGQASALGFDIPETYVYTRDATAVRMTPHIQKVPWALAHPSGFCVSPPEFPCSRKQLLLLQTLLYFLALHLKANL